VDISAPDLTRYWFLKGAIFFLIAWRTNKKKIKSNPAFFADGSTPEPTGGPFFYFDSGTGPS
jgi:hypothetical protein